MTRTKLSNLNDKEFLQYLAHKSDPSDEDIESMLRIEQLMDDVEDAKQVLVDAEEKRWQ